MSDNGNGLGFEGANNNYLAMEPNNGLGGTVGNFTSPTPPPIPPPIPPPTVVHPQLTPSMPHNSLSSHNPFSSFDKSALNHSRGDFGRDVTDHGSSHSPTAEHQPDDHSALGQHQSGQHQLGQHQLGQHQLGQDHGTTGGDASIDKVQEVNQTGEAPPTNYTVHSGDNLWDISKDNLGGGEHWHQLYQGNETVIGANPDIIHPGQHLHVDGAHNFTTPAAGPAHSLAHSPTHAPVHLTGHAPTHTPTHPVAHGQAQASGHPTAHRATTVGTGELKAQAQKLSNIQSDTDITSQAVDSSTTVANTR
ncbi:MAG: LysM peptidoglycan-binding domain-containing protein [Cyanobacteria bacterium REEB67]|nr:LysM peptidoglycan-binding domain-containing protein [Cyanobacteria bacterium REEB67]